MNIKKQIKKFISDEIIIKYQYFKKIGKRVNLKNPTTFSEKIQWIKLNGNLESVSKLVDKYEVRDYIKLNIGEEYLNKIYGVYDKVEDIDFEKLPNQFVIKNTNGSGYNYICKNKQKININELKIILNQWLKSDFYEIYREAQYKNCKNRILIEEYLEDKNGMLNDYKFFCFRGKVKMIQVDIDRFGEQKRNFYDCEWNILQLRSYGMSNFEGEIEKPNKLEEMIKLAEKLSKKVELLRVDFYYLNNKIYFGELTFTPANGMKPFLPESEDLRLASYINLEKYNLEVLNEC